MRFVKKRVLVYVFAVILIAIAVLSERSVLSNPPSYASVQRRFINNQENIKTVVAYLSESPYSSIVISNPQSVGIFADFNDIDITDVSVRNAIHSLLGTRKYKIIYKRQNTIVMEQWSGIKDIGCGIAYSTDSDSEPSIEFVTELQSLAENGWYYYVSDYNLWRVQSEDSRTAPLF